jgi:5,10-methenyltetrahydrofolate synthetase
MTQIGGAYLPLENEIAADFNYLTHHLSLKLSYPIKTLEGMGFAMSAEPLGKLWLSEPYEVVSPQWLLVPGLAFSLKGERLGRGGGYYDRYLERYIPVRIALTYSALICDNIPVESHDALMDFIITENFCWDVYQQKKI